ncbi:serine/arginine-rich splicing factor 8-like [Camellia sinensis]|uniref:serine/arginine-rich splicing factor 8-like n=1 Tax=Camellia sinensis TaxID=4442 RepID=UPI001036906F|nr:serine/arginine-rich splicing factor 8-like [Camellia sinensis]
MERGGWNLVLRRRRSGRVGNQSSQNVDVDGLFTIFVDEIPNSMDPKSLYTLFSKFGIVKDIFIPMKRRQVLGSWFEFVRYDCKVVADMAVQKADGLWCDNKALKVKIADYKKMEQKQLSAKNNGGSMVRQRQQRIFALGNTEYEKEVQQQPMMRNIEGEMMRKYQTRNCACDCFILIKRQKELRTLIH